MRPVETAWVCAVVDLVSGRPNHGPMPHTGMIGRATTVVVRYQVRPGRQAAFLQLLARHWATLWHAGLVTQDPVQHFAGAESPRQASTVFEIFSWVSPQAAASAHVHPEISLLWRRMAELCVGDGRPVSTPAQPVALV